MCATRRDWHLLLSGLLASWLWGGTALGADISWTGATSDDWHTNTNWSQQCPGGPFCFFGVPDDDDNVTISGNLITGKLVELSADAEVNSLRIADGFKVSANGFQLDAGGGQGSVDNLLQLDGFVTELEIEPHPGLGRDLVTNRFSITGGAKLSLLGATVEATHAGQSTIAFQSQIEGHGRVIFDNFPGSPGSVLANDGAIRVIGGNLEISAPNGATLDLDGNNGNGILDVDDGIGGGSGNRTLTISSPLTDSFDGLIAVGQGDRLHFQPAWSFGNPLGSQGAIHLNGHSGTATLSGGELSVFPSANGAAINVNSGIGRIEADLFMPTGIMTVADNTTLVIAGDATLSTNAQLNGGSGYDLIIEKSMSIQQPIFDWDSFAPANHLTTIKPTGDLFILSDQIDTGDNKFDGTLHLQGRLTIDTATSWIHNGRINMESVGGVHPSIFGRPLFVGDGLDNGLDALIDVAGTSSSIIYVPTTFRGDAEIQIAAGAELRFHNQTSFQAGVETTGPGHITNTDSMTVADGIVINTFLINAGTLNIGGNNDFGELIVDRYTQASIGTRLNLELQDTSPGDFDCLLVDGIAALSGTLGVDWLGAGLPGLGDQFPIITATSVTGMFDTLFLPPVDPGNEWHIQYNSTSVILEVVTDVDLDNDGDVDGNDFLLIQRTNPGLIAQWESQFVNVLGTVSSIRSANSGTTVPEPSSGLLLTGIFLLAYFRQTAGA